jgi:hypothetical protein
LHLPPAAAAWTSPGGKKNSEETEKPGKNLEKNGKKLGNH